MQHKVGKAIEVPVWAVMDGDRVIQVMRLDETKAAKGMALALAGARCVGCILTIPEER